MDLNNMEIYFNSNLKLNFKSKFTITSNSYLYFFGKMYLGQIAGSHTEKEFRNYADELSNNKKKNNV